MPAKEVKVMLLTHTPDPEKTCALAARMCYSHADVDALRADDSDEFNAWLDGWITAHIEELAVQYAQETGDLLDGMAVVTREVPATPAGIRPNGTLRVDGAKVAEALGANLGAAVAGLLGGGA